MSGTPKVKPKEPEPDRGESCTSFLIINTYRGIWNLLTF
jgi:hypothetical protein